MICPVSYPSMIDRESKSCRSFCPDTTGFFVFASTPTIDIEPFFSFVPTPTIDREPKKVAANDIQSAATMEVPPRFELGSQGFADPCLTTWPRHHMNISRKKGTRGAFLQLTNGAGDEARTRYLHLGKVALYQMSYTRIWCLRSELNQRHADFQSAALPTELQRHVEPSKTRLRCFKNGDPERTRTVDLQRDRLAC